MPLNPQILTLLQTAGQSLYDADLALQATVTEYGDSVKSAMKANPFDLGNDERFEEWKTIARLSKAVAQIEDELKKVYGVANVWTSVGTLSSAKATAIALPSFTAPSDLEVLLPVDATDVIDKRQRKKTEKVSRKVTSWATGSKNQVGSLRGNTAKLLATLQSQLTPTSFTKLNRTNLALEIGFPKGSIGASFTKLKELGYLEEDGHGGLRLSQKR